MAMADFIPAGRTSLVKRGQTAIQVQTEYAYRPVPRITTTILQDGRVLHKVERGLDKAISSLEEKVRMEETIRRQHVEVLGIIKTDDSAPAVPPPAPAVEQPAPAPRKPKNCTERLEAIPGVVRVYAMDNRGHFKNPERHEEFLFKFKDEHKILTDLLSIFGELPGVGLLRERGVYEVEYNSLYLVSEGTEMFFVAVDDKRRGGESYEQAIHRAIDGR
ncbi:MAG: hypothetical protein KKA42_04365 [candidate division Zixibacteria bacterium]|nr:hypothetical protein [candidate division Zixibacteria bacterium]